MRLTILDRYLIQQTLTIALFAMVIFTLAWLAPEKMLTAIQGLMKHKLSLDQGFLYLLYQIPSVLAYCIPISSLFAGVYMIRRMSLSAELIAILSSGVSFARVTIPISIVGLILGILFFMTQDVFQPQAAHALRDLNEITRIDSKNKFTPLVTYVEKSPLGYLQNFVLISPKANEGQNKFIFLFYQTQNQETWINRIITATQGVWDENKRLWQLTDGVQYFLDPDGIYKNVKPFAHLSVHTSSVANALLEFPTGNPAEFSTKQLEKYTRLLRRSQQTEDALFYEVRLFQRYFLPFVPLILATLGAYIGIERSRAKRNMGLIFAAGLLLLYNVSVPTLTTLGSIGMMPPILAAFLPLIITTAAGLGIIRFRQASGT